MIHGSGFAPLAVHHLGAGDQVKSGFSAWLGATALRDVTWVDDQTLSAVVPAGVAGDPLDLAVEGPTGRGMLRGAFRAIPAGPPTLAVVVNAPAEAEQGQPFTIEADVVAEGVTGVAMTWSGPVEASGSVSPDPLVFVASASAAAIGTAQLVATVTAQDAFTGEPVTATSPPAPVSILRGPMLRAIPHPLPAVDVGQSFTVAVDVVNGGDADALAVAVAPPVTPAGTASLSGAPAAPVDVPAGATRSVSWTYAGTAAGDLVLSTAASGTDALANRSLALEVAWPATVVQTPASLSAAAAAPAVVSVAQAFTLQVDVTNTGDAAAQGVASSLPAGAPFDVVAAPAALDVPGHSTAHLAWQLSGRASGTFALAPSVAGTDVNSGDAASATATAATIAVQEPGALSATASLPASVLVPQSFTLALTVTNTGGATVDGVTPASPVLAGAAVVSGPAPASATLAGGTSATFSWVCQASTAGAVSATLSASGTDANDGGTRSASASAAATAVEASLIASDPFADGTTYSYLFDFNGRVYLGPNRSGSGGVRMQPDGSSVESVTFTFNGDPAQKDANSWGNGGPYPSLGYTGCTADTAQCGPDNENGRGLYASGAIAGTPWLFASGSISGGGLGHLYATTDTTVAPDFSYVGLKSVLNTGETQGTSAMIVFHDRVYFGFPSAKGNRPFLLVLNTMPPVPGFDAASSDAVSLAATDMPGLGANGSPKNSAATQMIDAFASFNDRLYLGNNGGWMRSTTNAPGSYATSPSDWTSTTPAAAAYAAKTSTTTSKTAGLLPADRALPQMAVFNGLLYAARNTTTGPQLWVCNPTAAANCDPGSWSLVAPNTAGDLQATQFNSANNASITLLVATAAHLYVGYDDAVDGVRLYRSATGAPATAADFAGQGGCSAASGATCPGLGGNGLGAGATRFFDGRALSYGGAGYLYLTAGTGTGSVSVFRLAE